MSWFISDLLFFENVFCNISCSYYKYVPLVFERSWNVVIDIIVFICLFNGQLKYVTLKFHNMYNSKICIMELLIIYIPKSRGVIAYFLPQM